MAKRIYYRIKQKGNKSFSRKAISLTLAFLIVFQTIIGVFAPVDFSLDPPYLESQNAEAASWYGTAGWGFRKKITIDNTKVPNTDQANFPVLVNRLDDDWKDTGSGGNVGQTDGGDFLFTSSDGQTKLSHEIEKYTNTTGELIAWVKIPSLSASADTEIYLYYGNAGCDDQWDAAGGTWDSDFEMVQHMNEDPSGGAPQMIDSTGNLNNGTSSGTMLTEDQVAGQVDGSLDFDGTDDFVDCGNDNTLNVDYVTVSFWLKLDSWVPAGGILAKGTNTLREYWIWTWDDAVSFEIDQGGYKNHAWEPSLGQWEHLALTYNGSNVITYRNGVEENNYPQSTGPINLTTTHLLLGDLPDWSHLDGTLDEVRISSTARSADWIATEYNNQSDSSTFYEIGIQEVASPTALTSWSYRKAITIDESKIPDTLATDLVNFPVLINLTSDDNLAANAQADFDDILFTSSATAWDTGTENDKLAHEIESYNSTTGELQAWVNIPILDYNNDTVIYMYYGNGSTASQQNMEEVWDGNTKLVQHMQEDPSGGAPQMIDSTNNSNNGTSGGTMLTEDQVAGQVDGSLDFDGTDDYVDTNFIPVAGSADRTITMWINPDTANQTEPTLIEWGELATGKKWNLRLANGVLRVEIEDSGYTSLLTPTAGQMSFVAVTLDGATLGDHILYLNGNSENATGITTVNTGNTINARIGHSSLQSSEDRYFNGTIDEVRVSNTARSADWIATEYNNQSDPSTFYEIGIQEVASPTALTSWSYRKAITIDESKIPDTLATDLVNFPVLINLTSDDDLTANAQADFDDILFTSSATAWDTGTENDKLAHEIESYNSTTGELQAWVNIPILDYNDDTVIYMYYGNGLTASQQNMEEVWDGNTKLVQHLQESPANDVAEHYDSTNNNNDGTPKNFNSIATSTTDGTGQVDGANVFDGVDDYVDCGDPADGSFDFGTDDFSISAWIKLTNTVGTKDIVSKHDHRAIEFRLNNNHVELWIAESQFIKYSIISVDTQCVAISRVSGTVTIYVDGIDKGSQVLNGNIDTAEHLKIGIRYGGSHPFLGTIDEVRISNVARSADWIATEYNNQSDPSTFYEIGIQEVASPTALTSWSYRKAITIDESKIPDTLATDLVNFPVLINLTSDDNLAANAQADFDDILFTSSATAWDTGTENDKLAHEIESYNSTTGELQAWVNIPVLDYNDDTVIYMYYGNGTANNQENMEEVWDGNTKLVQHLQETPANDVAGHYDSTNNNNDGTPKNFNNIATSTTDGTGQVDGADVFDGMDDYVTVADSASLNIDGAAISFSAWIAPDFINTETQNPFIFDKTTDNTEEYRVLYQSSINHFRFRVFTSNGAVNCDIEGGSWTAGTWHHLAGYYDGSNVYIFWDGVQQNSAVQTGNITTNNDSLVIGSSVVGNDFEMWIGAIDSVRISSIAHSADWIATEYNNQSDPSNFYDLGVEDTRDMDHFTIIGSASQTAGTSQEITITAKDSGGSTITAYSGDKDLIFSGANSAPDSTVPTFSDKDSADINIGLDTTLTFTNGVATSSMKLYNREDAEIEVDDTLYNSTGSADYDLDVIVAGASLDNFLVEAPATATSGIAFSTTITSRDEFNNTTLSVSGDTTIAVDQGNIDTATLAQAQFTDDGTWTGNFTITNITEQPAVSLSAENGTPTGSDSITVLGIPANPSGCSASIVSDTEFSVAWSDNSTVETGYKIERKTDGASWVEIDTDTDGSPYSDATTLADHKYEYRVLGYNSVGNSAAYSTDAVEHYTTPDTPSNVAGAYVSDSEFTIIYTDNAAVEDTHRIERCSNANCDGTYETNLTIFESSPQTDTTNLAVNSRYRWRARAETPDALASNYGTSNYNYTTPAAPIIGTPAYVDDTHITVNWSDTSAYEDGFRVWVSVDGGAYAEVTSGANTVGANIETYIYTSSANHSYKFKITAHSPNDLISAESAESETVYTTPAAPTIGTPAWVSDNEITVNWIDNSNHEDGFRVWVSENGGAFTEATSGVNSTTTDIQTYSYTGGSLSHNYKFKVQSHLVNNDSSELDNMSGESITVYTTTNAPIIGTPVADSSTAITWNWTDNSDDEESFRLDFTLGGGTDVDDITADLETHQTIGLDPNTRYSTHIHSYRADRGESDASADATIYTLANVPANLSLNADSQDQITASYSVNSNSGNTEYYVENITAGTNSDWTTSLGWASDGLVCGENYTFKVKARNGDEVETVFTDTVSAKTQDCGSGLPPSASNPPASPAPSEDNSTGEFKIVINNNDEYTSSPTVSLKLTAGADTTKMAISDNPEFNGASQIAFQENIEWEICRGGSRPAPTTCVVYAKFYTKYGQPSEVVSDSIILDTANQEEEHEKQEEDIKDTEDTGEEDKLAEPSEPEWIDIPKEVVESEAQDDPQTQEPDEPSIIDDIIDIFKPKPEPEPEPEIKIEDLVAKETPASMKGEWNLFPQEQINEFVLAPLPKGLERLAQKFPELQNTFKEVGISKITDLQKLRDYSLSLSGLTKSLGLEEKDLAL
ncbi:MAG: DUF2341 domain-containing protein, partial [Candidatus Pacebacteria bacterium]|nr:DUF2341 domain-containing protein [Candidatus Paceibacterota bacterium]